MPSPHCLLLLLFTFSLPLFSQAWSFDYPSPIANLPSLWTNNNTTIPYNATYTDGSMVRAILIRQNTAGYGPSFACGFFCAAPCDGFVFAVFFLSIGDPNNPAYNASATPRIVWTANRYRPVRENATLKLSKDGSLALHDFDGSLVWSTNTSGRPVAGMNLSKNGNLVLFDVMGTSLWESFDYPTDTLVIGQSLRPGQRLTAASSTTRWVKGQFFLTVLDDGMYAFIVADPPQVYYRKKINVTEAVAQSQKNISSEETKKYTTYISYTKGSLSMFANFSKVDIKLSDTPLPWPSSVQYIRLDGDGHLRIYGWEGVGWKASAEVLHPYPDDCAYPTVCGEYGICSKGQCSCPGRDSGYRLFHQVDDRHPALGCSLVTPLLCDSMQDQQLLPLPNVTYFNFTNLWTTDEESCKGACLKTCSCKAAFFQYAQNTSNGSCYLTERIFSLMNYQPEEFGYNLSAYIKIQMLPPPPSSKKLVVTAYHVGAIILIILICVVILIVRRVRAKQMGEDDPFKGAPGMPTRFSYKQLREATDNFSKKLGQGGFGPVYEGKLGDVKIAVKCLHDMGHGKEEFIAEVLTIGSIHHINLVRLIGYCSDRFHSLLVYEHMSNGSLDKWIFRKDQRASLDWATRYRIIMDIAKGLVYLHEECRQKIAHLDIKPGNILLDGKFSAKISDFGLAKLIDRDQSHVMTKIRGTRGYLAPEWLSSTISEKADVYSFGIVMLEIVTGQKNLDNDQPEGSTKLIKLLQEKIKEHQVPEIVDRHNHDMQLHMEEAIEVIKLAVWCLQRDCNKRPLMSQVVKVLEGAMDSQTSAGYINISNQ